MEKSNLGLQKQSSKAFVFYKGMRYALVCACTAHARAPKRNWAPPAQARTARRAVR